MHQGAFHIAACKQTLGSGLDEFLREGLPPCLGLHLAGLLQVDVRLFGRLKEAGHHLLPLFDGTVPHFNAPSDGPPLAPADGGANRAEVVFRLVGANRFFDRK